MPYFTLLQIIVSLRFFGAAAEMIGWNRNVGAMLSLGTWIVCACVGWSGLLGQIVLFVGWGMAGMLRDWKGKRREA